MAPAQRRTAMGLVLMSLCRSEAAVMAPRLPIHTIYLRRSRKAGSGTLDLFFTEQINRRKLPRSIKLDTGTMHPFDKCCVVPCDVAVTGNETTSRSPPYKTPGVFTITHLREPLSWRQVPERPLARSLAR
jgi:hypothetical protein